MMRKQLCMAGILAVCFMVTGCGHEHTWVEATCTETKTCSECGETEGEALGHTWVEATCAEAKHCSVCGESEGEPLGHTLTEANYQQASVCEVCGETVGEPLQADFEKYGLTCDAVQNTKYPISIPWNRDGIEKVTAGEVVFSDYEIFDSDDTHEASEGYEWRAITITEICDSNDAYVWNDAEFFPSPIVTDYYCNGAYNESTNTYTFNYNGADYTDVKFDVEILQNEWIDDIWTFQVRCMFCVPKGYDGLVAMVGDGNSFTGNDQLDGDNAFFRLK